MDHVVTTFCAPAEVDISYRYWKLATYISSIHTFIDIYAVLKLRVYEIEASCSLAG